MPVPRFIYDKLDLYARARWNLHGVESITLNWISVPVPRQPNTKDCGVWVCVYMYCFYRSWEAAERADPEFSWTPKLLEDAVKDVVFACNPDLERGNVPNEAQILRVTNLFRKFMLRCLLGLKKTLVPSSAESGSSDSVL